MIEITVNGTKHSLDVDPETPLLWVLRENLGLTGTKYSCGIAECGACTVLVNGEATPSCVTPVSTVHGAEIVTIEGFSGPVADSLRQAWLEDDVPQCGFCQPGQLLTAGELLTANPNPDDGEIRQSMSRVLCRCGTYQEIHRAIRKASEANGQEKS